MTAITKTDMKILAAAEAVFSEKGFSAATVKDIATRAGIGTLTVSRRFTTKERLFASVVSKYDNVSPNSQAWLASLQGKSLEIGLIMLLSNMISFLFERIHMMRIFINESGYHESVRGSANQFYAQLHTCLKRHIHSFHTDIHGKQLGIISDLLLSNTIQMFWDYHINQNIWSYNDVLEKSFQEDIAKQIRFFLESELL